MIDFQNGSGQGTRSGTGAGIFCRWAGRPAGRLALHSPWPGTFSIRHILTHTQIIRLTLLTQIVIFFGEEKTPPTHLLVDRPSKYRSDDFFRYQIFGNSSLRKGEIAELGSRTAFIVDGGTSSRASVRYCTEVGWRLGRLRQLSFRVWLHRLLR